MLIFMFNAIVVAAIIIDRKQKYSDDRVVNRRPSPGVLAGIGRRCLWLRRNCYLYIDLLFSSGEESSDG